MTWLRPLPLAALLTPLIGGTAPKGLAPLLFLLGAWGWLAAWRQGRLSEALERLPPYRLAMPARARIRASATASRAGDRNDRRRIFRLRGNDGEPDPLVLVPLWGLVAWALVSVLWTPAQGDGLATWLKLTAVAVSLPPLLLAVPEEQETVQRALLAGFALMVAFLAVEVASDLAMHRIAYELQGKADEFEAPVLNRRVVVLLLVAWPAAYVLVLRGKPWLAGGAVAATVLVALGNVSHSAKLAAVLALAVLLLGLALPRLVPALLAAAIVLGVTAAPAIPPLLLAPERWQARLETTSYSALHRLYIWEFTSARIAERPATGWGLDAAPHVPGGDEKLPEGGNRMNVHPHNGTLQVWLELGGVGAALFGALMALTALAIRRLQGRAAPALAAAQLTAALTVVHLSFGLWQTAWMAALALAAVLTVAVARPAPGGLSCRSAA